MRLILIFLLLAGSGLGDEVRDARAWRRFAGEPALRQAFLDTTPLAERVETYAAILVTRRRLASRLREVAEVESALAALAPASRELLLARAQAFRDAADLVQQWQEGGGRRGPSPQASSAQSVLK